MCGGVSKLADFGKQLDLHFFYYYYYYFGYQNGGGTNICVDHQAIMPMIVTWVHNYWKMVILQNEKKVNGPCYMLLSMGEIGSYFIIY